MSEENSERTLEVLARSSSGAIGGDIVSKGLLFLLNIVLARTLTETSYGHYGLTISIATIAIVGVSDGLRQGAARFLSMDTDGPESLPSDIVATTTVTLSVIIGSIVALALRALLMGPNAPILLFDRGLPLSFALPGIVTGSLMFTVLGLLRGRKQVRPYIVLKNLVHPILLLTITLVILSLSFAVEGALAVWSTVFLVVSLLGIFYVFKDGTLVFRLPRFAHLRQLSTFAAPVSVAGVLWITFSRIDIVMLGAIVGGDDVGLYNAVVQLTFPLMLGLVGVEVLFGPLISQNQGSQSKEVTGELLRAGTRWIGYLVGPVLIVISLTGPHLLSLFGPSYGRAYFPLLLLAIGKGIAAMFGLTASTLIMTGHERLELLNVAGAVVLNASLNLILIPHFHMAGAAVATGFSYVLLHIVRALEVNYILSLPVLSLPDLKAFAPVLLLLLVTIPLGPITDLLGALLLSLSVVLTLLYILWTRTAPSQDKNLARKILKDRSIRHPFRQ